MTTNKLFNHFGKPIHLDFRKGGESEQVSVQVSDYAKFFIYNKLDVILDNIVTPGNNESDYLFEQVKNQVKKQGNPGKIKN